MPQSRTRKTTTATKATTARKTTATKAPPAPEVPPPSPVETMDIHSLLARPQQERGIRREKVIEVCLAGQLVGQWQELHDRFTEVSKRQSGRLAGDPKRRELSEQMAALEEQIRARTYPFRMVALPPGRWERLMADHPPRKDDQGQPHPSDAGLGVNISTFFYAAVRAMVVDPTLSDEEWTVLLGSPDNPDAGDLNPRQADELYEAAWTLNRHGVDVPFSLAASTLRKYVDR